MKTTAAKFVSAIFATILASSSVTAAPDPENEEKEKPADTCQLGPSASAPPGSHWYYRSDRANKRNCWYLGEAKSKSARKSAAEEDSAVAEKTVTPASKKPVAQRAITDAHAELPAPQTSAEPDSAVATQRTPAAPAGAQRAVGTRWPEPAAASPPAPPPAARVAETQSQPPTPVQTQTTPAAAPPRPFAPQPLPPKVNAADRPLSLPMLLTILVGGLSVIGVMASVIFSRDRARQDKPRPRRRLSKSAPMPPVPTAEPSLPEKPLPEVSRKPPPEDSRAPDDPTRRLQRMLADIQKRAAA